VELLQVEQTLCFRPSLQTAAAAAEHAQHIHHQEITEPVAVLVVVLPPLVAVQIQVELVTRQAHHHHKATMVVTHQTQVAAETMAVQEADHQERAVAEPLQAEENLAAQEPPHQLLVRQ
jgi:D-alanyl-D-alanine carboxypeptidase